jgi:hypothetical protein
MAVNLSQIDCPLVPHLARVRARSAADASSGAAKTKGRHLRGPAGFGRPVSGIPAHPTVSSLSKGPLGLLTLIQSRGGPDRQDAVGHPAVHHRGRSRIAGRCSRARAKKSPTATGARGWRARGIGAVGAVVCTEGGLRRYELQMRAIAVATRLALRKSTFVDMPGDGIIHTQGFGGG